MKKYYPVDFDEKGNAVLGNAKNTPTSNSFIPTTWAPGGSDQEKQGLKSITISPAITTTPELDSMFPIYWDDLTEEQKRDGVLVHGTVEPDVIKSGDTYQFTITPTADWYVYDVESAKFGEKGEPYTITVTAENKDSIGLTFGVASDNVQAETTKIFLVNLAADV